MSALTVTTSSSSYGSFHEHLSPPSTVYGCHSSSTPRAVGEGPEPKISNNERQPQFQCQSLGNSKNVDDENENGIDIHISNDNDNDIKTARTNNGVASFESDNGSEEEPHGDMVSVDDDDGDEKSGATPNSSIQCTSRKRHSVRFSTAEFRYYPITVGDNPSVTSGIPLTIGWDHWKEATRVVPFDQFREDGDGDFEIIIQEGEDGDEYDREYDLRTGRDADDAREETNTRDRREADRTAAGPGTGYPTACARRRAILPAHQQPCPFRCFRARRVHRHSGPRLRDPAERATLLMQTGHTRQELLRALHETTRSRNRLLRTAREQRVFPRVVLAVLDWIHEVGESCPRPCPGSGGARWCGPSRGTEGEDGDRECGSENQPERKWKW